MKLRLLGGFLLVLGFLAILMGAVFTLQGLGILGPSTSMMVNNADWITYGLAVVAAGGALGYAGLRVRRTRGNG